MRAVAITGASTGIGRAAALHMDARGWRVFAGVRREQDGTELSACASERLTPLILDVTDADQVSAAAERIEETVGDAGLDGLVNNAGIVVLGPIETTSIEDFRRQIEINLVGQVAVSQALFPQIRRARGRIVFMSSIGGRLAYPFMGAYSASKYGVEAVADSLRREVRRWGIGVSLIEPGVIDTSLWERTEQSLDGLAARSSPAHDHLYGRSLERSLSLGRRILQARAAPPERVARAIEQALTAERPRNRYLIGLDAHFQLRASQLFPSRAVDWAAGRIFG